MKKTTLAILITAIISSSPSFADGENNYIFNYSSTKGLFKPLDLTSQFSAQDALHAQSGSLTFRVKNGSGFGTFLGAADPSSSTQYLSFYSQVNNPSGKDTFGMEFRTGGSQIIKGTVPTSTNAYRTVTYTFDKENNKISIYVDGVEVISKASSTFFNDIPTLSNVTLGETRRSTNGRYNTMRFNGDIFYADFEREVLTPEKVVEKHEQLKAFQAYSLDKKQYFNAHKTDGIALFSGGQKGAKNYRIPSLFTTKDNVVIAAIDKRNQHAGDWGDIDTVIRRSLDGGKTWEDDQVLVDLVSQSYGDKNSAFLIDPQMVQDRNTGRIFMIVDMFPEMQGLFNFPNNGEGTGYKNIGDHKYRLLTDSHNNQYTVRENGVVYDESNKPTNYKVIVEGNRNTSYHDLGDLYEGETKVGNIFLNSENPESKKAPLTAKRTSYLWMIHSDDNGATWSNPVDLTPQVKADWMQFLGTGPGNGIQLKNGNLVVPVYYTNNVGRLNSQSPAVIISSDGGKTWTRGESPIDRWEYDNGGSRELNASSKQMTESQIIELDSGDLKMFSRNLMSDKVVISTSKDGGYTWQKTYQVDDVLLEPYSQLSVIKYSKRINGKEIVIFANPHASNRSRTNGKVWLGEVQDDGSIEWKFNTSITTGNYAYNSLTELPNGDIGLLYEESNTSIKYVQLNLQELVWHDNLIYRDIRNMDESQKEFSLNSPKEETLYKIGDGEMVKVGTGINHANLVVNQGTATLNQQADSNGETQAFNHVIVKENAKVRLGSSEQVNLSKINLENGTLDLNGNSINIDDNQLLTGLRSQVIEGNIINENNTMSSILTYSLAGEHGITGKLGDKLGSLDFVYNPTTTDSSLVINGDSILNEIDVKSGAITYSTNTKHQAKSLKLRKNTKLSLSSTTETNIENANIDGQLLVEAETDQITKLKVNTSGTGQIDKTGSGLLIFSGNLSHTGSTNINSGQVQFDGNLTGGELILASDTVFGGNATISGNSIWKNNSLIKPGVNQSNDGFDARMMKFGNVVNEGANLFLRVKNDSDDITSWKHDKVLVHGNLTSEKEIPVDIQFLGEQQALSDTNKNGKYDPDEGISLIQVFGDSEVGKFTLGRTFNVDQQLTNLFQYALVSVDKPVSNTQQSLSTATATARFFDYRLQSLLIDENGNSLVPEVRVITSKGLSVTAEEKPLLSEEEALKLVLEDKNRELSEKEKERQKALKDKLAAEDAAKKAQDDKLASDESARKALEDKISAEKSTEQALAAKKAAEEAAKKAQEDKLASDESARKALEDKISAEKAVEQALAAKKAAEDKLKSAQQTSPKNRVAISPKVPSYLVANNAILNQGETVLRQFMDNVWSEDKKGFYISQQNGNSRYTSDLSFIDYGYGYKSNQSSTLLGGFVPVSENMELHTAVGFNTQTVTPKAADGSSETKYKSTSFLVGAHNKWDNIILNTQLGYHIHRGKVSTAEHKNIANINAKQLQIGGEVGYDFHTKDIKFTPIVGLRYQKVKTNIDDHTNKWNISMKPYNVFSQYVGANLSWNNEIVHLSLGTFYEHNDVSSKNIDVYDGKRTAKFVTGDQGDSLLIKVGSEFALTKQISLGLKVEHRHAISDAKLRQTQFGGKLEYRF